MRSQTVVEIDTEDLEQEVRRYLERENYGLNDGQVETIVSHYAIAEYADIRSHGLSKLLWDCQFFPGASDRRPTMLPQSSPEHVYLDMNGAIGALGLQFVVDDAHHRGDAVIYSFCNLQPYGSLFPVARQLTSLGYTGILMNSTERRFMRMNGGKEVLGTNPFCICMPVGKEECLIFDTASSKVNISQLFQQKQSDQSAELPADTYLDWRGLPTRNVSDAQYVEPFGGYKGFGLAFMVDMLTNFVAYDGYATPSTTAINGCFMLFQSEYNDERLRAFMREFQDRYPGQRANELLSEVLRRKKVQVDAGIIDAFGIGAR